jgi:hypothetical protein
MFTCVINTIALAKDADRISSGGRPYSERAWLLRNVILPWYHDLGIFDEIVVVGEYEKGPYHRYVPCAPVYHTVADALIQRDMGFAAGKRDPNDWVLFQHDDHMFDGDNPLLGLLDPVYGVLAPSRWTRQRTPEGEPINDGSQDGYIMGHAVLMRNRVAERVPWTKAAPVFTWDMEYTKALCTEGIAWRYAPEYKVWDMEQGANLWG